MNKKLLISIAIVLMSVIFAFAFRANFGIDMQDANLYIVKTDNALLTDNIIQDAYALRDIVKVERVEDSQLYLYFQPLSDNVASDITDYASRYNLISEGNMIYRFANEEYRLILNRAVTLGLVMLFVIFIYQGVEMRGISWKRWQVGYYIVSDFLLTAGVLIVSLGLAALFGEMGMKMDDEFITTIALSIGISLVYRIYEIEIIKRMVLNVKGKSDYKEIKTIFKSRKPELILLACILLLAGFMPFVVLSGNLTVISLFIAISIGLNFVVSTMLKPDFLIFMLEQGEETGILKKNRFEKQW